MRDSKDNPNCPYCLSPVEEQEEKVRCPKCGVVHHADCWKTNGKCSVYGCDGWATWNDSITERIAPHHEDQVDLSAGQATERQDRARGAAASQDEERMPCINCGRPVPPGKILCWHCRKSKLRIRLDNCFGPAVILLCGFFGIVALIVKVLS